jgi:hypothetical protein
MQAVEFYDARLDTHLRVEVDADEVLVRATRNTYSPGRRVCFLRELAAEGFIPDHYQWFNSEPSWSSVGVRRQIDAKWLAVPPRRPDGRCGRSRVSRRPGC